MSYDKAISYSGKKLFKQCPKRWHQTYILGIREPSGPAAERGTRLHDALERFFLGGSYPAQDKTLAPWRRFMEALTVYNPSPEADLAVDKDWQPVAFDSPDAFYRGKADLIYSDSDRVTIYDWKSGKKYPDHEEQGKSYVAMCTAAGPYATGFVYLDHPLDVLHFKYSSDEREDHISTLIQEVTVIREATEYPATAGDGCRWCPMSWRRGGDCHAAA